MSIMSWNLCHPHIDIELDETDPWSLPIILHTPRDVEITHEDAILAAARGVALLLSDERTAPDGEWHEALEGWMFGRIRKVVRRARTQKWQAIRELPGVDSVYGNAFVRILLPHRVSSTPPEVACLQVSGLDLPRHEIPSHGPGEFDLYIALNPNVDMSTGKSMAQAGHIAHLATLTQDVTSLGDWMDNGLGTYLAHWNDGPWAVEVQDAGFTEVIPGTTTAKGDFYR